MISVTLKGTPLWGREGGGSVIECTGWRIMLGEDFESWLLVFSLCLFCVVMSSSLSSEGRGGFQEFSHAFNYSFM